MSIDHPAGYPGGLLRFIVFVPFGIYEGIARNHWNVIKSHDILRGGVFDSSIAKGEQLAAKWVSLQCSEMLPGVKFPTIYRVHMSPQKIYSVINSFLPDMNITLSVKGVFALTLCRARSDSIGVLQFGYPPS